MKKFECQNCSITFYTHREFLKHKRILHEDKTEIDLYKCNYCSTVNQSLEDFRRHIRNCTLIKPPFDCAYCNRHINNIHYFKIHTLRCVTQKGSGLSDRIIQLPKTSKFILSKSAFKSFLQQFELYPEDEFDDVEEFFSFYREEILDLIQIVLKKLKSTKIQFCIQVTFARDIDKVTIYTIAYFSSENYSISSLFQIKYYFHELISRLEYNVQQFEERGSGWKIEEIDRLDIRVGVYKPQRGGCQEFKLPPQLLKKRG